jgi:hypothetical protein
MTEASISKACGPPSKRRHAERRKAAVLALTFGARDLTWGLEHAGGFVAIVLGGLLPPSRFLCPWTLRFEAWPKKKK